MDRSFWTTTVAVAVLAATAAAHDTWVQTNTNLIRTGDAVHIDLMLGNHGNDHRDFKLASKLAPEQIQSFDGDRPGRQEVRPEARPGRPGLRTEGRLLLGQVRPGEGRGCTSPRRLRTRSSTTASRSARSAAPRRTSWPASRSTRSSKDWPGFDKPLGHGSNWCPKPTRSLPMGPGMPIKVKLLFDGQAAGRREGQLHPARRDAGGRHRRRIRANHRQGRPAEFTPKTGNYYLVVAHHKTEREEREVRAHDVLGHADRVRARKVPVLRRIIHVINTHREKPK